MRIAGDVLLEQPALEVEIVESASQHKRADSCRTDGSQSMISEGSELDGKADAER